MPARSNSYWLVFTAVLVAVTICVIWVYGPSFYTSLQSSLPSSVGQQTSDKFADQKRRIAQLRTRVQKLRETNRQLMSSSQSVAVATSSLPEIRSRASVIARPPQSPYDTILIDKGRSAGINPGAPVWWPPGIYLGQVTEVRGNNSLVELVSSPQFNHVGRINNEITLETVGQGGGKMSTVLPGNLSVGSSSQVVSDRYGLIYGVVSDVRPGPVESQKRVLVRPAVPASVIESVYVGTN
jgi:cell shape-determining protein MreC